MTRTTVVLAVSCLLWSCDSVGPYGSYCSQVPSDNLPASSPSFPSHSASFNTNDDYAWLGTVIPGCFAGLWLAPVNGKNTLVIGLVDTTQLAAAVDALRTYEPTYLTNYGQNGVITQRAKWGFLQLYEWLQFVESRRPGLWTELGIDVRGNRVLLGVGSSADSLTALGVLNSWGAPSDIYTLELSVSCDCDFDNTCGC